jgi:pilus assembly protein CpaB
MPRTQSSPKSPGLPDRLSRWALRRRRLLAAFLFCLAAGIAVHQLTPTSEIQVPVVVAGDDIPAGTVLTAEHLQLSHMAPSGLPDAAYEAPDPLIGQQLASPVRRGSIFTDASIVGPGLLTGAPPGTVAVPVRPADPSTLQLLGPGQRIDVALSTGNGYEEGSSTRILAHDVVVLWTSTVEQDAQWLGAPGGEGLVVVAAGPDEATALAGASSSGQVHLVLTGSDRQPPSQAQAG